MLNRVTVAGRIGKTPELKQTPSGVAVTSFSIACDRDFKSQSGEKITDWFEIVAWRGAAEFAAKYFTQGRQIIVDGRLQTRKWTDKDGNKRTATEIEADHLYFADSKREDAAEKPAAKTFEEVLEEDGDLPF